MIGNTKIKFLLILIPVFIVTFLSADNNETNQLRLKELLSEIQKTEEKFDKKIRIRFLSDSAKGMSKKENKYLENINKLIENKGKKLSELGFETPKLKEDSKPCIITFILDNNGNLISIKVHVSSGDKEIDQLFIDLLKKTSPFGKIPNELGKDYNQWHITKVLKFHQ